jgi:hypothetical protein
MILLSIPAILHADNSDASKGNHTGEAGKDEGEEVGVRVIVVGKEVDTVDSEDKAGE